MHEWIEQWHHDVTEVADLTLPEDIEHPACVVTRKPRLVQVLCAQCGCGTPTNA